MLSRVVGDEAIELKLKCDSRSGEVYVEGSPRSHKEEVIGQHLQTFFLRAVLARYIFAPRAQVVKRALEIIDVSELKTPMAVVHIRRTDKKTEDPRFKRTGHFSGLEEYVAPLLSSNVSWASIYLMTDDAAALAEMTDLLQVQLPHTKLV